MLPLSKPPFSRLLIEWTVKAMHIVDQTDLGYWLSGKVSSQKQNLKIFLSFAILYFHFIVLLETAMALLQEGELGTLMVGHK